MDDLLRIMRTNIPTISLNEIYTEQPIYSEDYDIETKIEIDVEIYDPRYIMCEPPFEDNDDKVLIKLVRKKVPIVKPKGFYFVPEECIKVLAEYTYEEWDSLKDVK